MRSEYTPLVSIIVASYNHSRFLDERLQSLLSQTYSNYEIIVIDDHSTDDSASVISTYLADSRIRLVQNLENTGWIKVSNQGFKESKGDYLLFANCDDSCSTTLISELVTFLQNNKQVGLVFSRSWLIDESGLKLSDDYAGRELKFRRFCEKDTVIDRKLMKRFLLRSCVIPNLSATLISREAFAGAKGFLPDYKVCADWDFYFRLVENYSVGYIAQPLNHFRQHRDTIRSATGELKLNQEILLLLLSKSKFKDNNFWDRIIQRFQAMNLVSEWIVRKEPMSFHQVVSLLQFVYHLDSCSLYFLPFCLNVRIFQILSTRFKRQKGPIA